MKKIIYIFLFLIISSSLNAQWQNVSNGLGVLYVTALTSNGSNIFAGNFIVTSDFINPSPHGVYLSSNNGNNWHLTSLTERINDLYVYNSRLFASTYYGGKFYSDNNGANWTLMNIIPEIHKFSSNSMHLFAGTSNGLYSSSDNGNNWFSILNVGDVTNLLAKDNYILAGSGPSLNVTSNSGANWVQVSVGYAVYSLATNGTEIFAGTYNGGVLKSTNNGYNWVQTTSFNASFISSLIAFGSNIIAGDFGGTGIFVSTNLGLTWTQKNEGLGTNNSINELMNANGYIFAGSTSGVWRRSLENLLSVNKISELVPFSYSLHQNYPNPFNPKTNIRFDVPRSSYVKLIIYDALGREVVTLVNENLSAGSYEISWPAPTGDGSSYLSGVYFYKLEANEFIDVRKMILIK